MRTADCHTHAVPDAYLDALEADIDAFGVRVHRVDGKPTSFEIVRPGGYFRGEPIRLHDAHRSLDERRRHMRDVEVCQQLLSPPTYVFGYDLGLAPAVRNARAYNDALSEWIENLDDFIGLGCVPLQYPEEAVRELARLRDLPGIVGVTVGTRVGGLELDDAALEPFYEAAAALEVTLFVHPNGVSEPERHASYYLTHSLGLPADTALGLARMVLGGVLDRHPSLRVIAAHGGGSFPYLFPRLAHIAQAVAGGSGQLDPDAVVSSAERLLFDTVVHGDALSYLLGFAGPQRLLLGSDYPAGTGIARPVDAVRALDGLTPDEFAAIAGGNLLRLTE